MKTRLYSKADCPQCYAAKLFLDKHDIPYLELRTDSDEKCKKEAIATGYLSAPVVVSEVGTWSGFRIDMFNALKFHLKGE